MTDRLFNRVSTVTLARRIRGNVTSSSPGDVIEFRGHTKFDVVTDDGSEANQALIQMYNLNNDTQAFLERENLLCILAVGYAQPQASGPKTIFIGTINKENGIHVKRKGPDIMTTLELSDAGAEIRSAVTSISLKGRVSLDQVLTLLLSGLQLSIGHRDRLPDFQFANGYSNSGRISKILNDLARKAGFSWSVQRGEIIILRGRNTETQRGILVTKNTGLIGSPMKNKEKVEFRTLIIPDLRPGKRVRLVSERYGTINLKASKVTFVGDNWEGDWMQEVEGVPL